MAGRNRGGKLTKPKPKSKRAEASEPAPSTQYDSNDEEILPRKRKPRTPKKFTPELFRRAGAKNTRSTPTKRSQSVRAKSPSLSPVTAEVEESLDYDNSVVDPNYSVNKDRKGMESYSESDLESIPATATRDSDSADTEARACVGACGGACAGDCGGSQKSSSSKGKSKNKNRKRQQQKEKKKHQPAVILTDDEWRAMLDWLKEKEQEIIWKRDSGSYARARGKDRLRRFDTAVEVIRAVEGNEYTGEQLHRWYRSHRTEYGKQRQKRMKSGSGGLTQRSIKLLNDFSFLAPNMYQKCHSESGRHDTVPDYPALPDLREEDEEDGVEPNENGDSGRNSGEEEARDEEYMPT